MENKKYFSKHTNLLGFTLIELLIVIAVMAILATVVFVALNPLGRFQDARNSRRWTDVNAILSAIKLDQVDNGGNYLQDIMDLDADKYYEIGTGGSCSDSCLYPTVILESSCLDLTGLVDEGYLPEMPVDPGDSTASVDATRYYLVKNSNGALTIGNCSEEAGSSGTQPEVEVTR